MNDSFIGRTIMMVGVAILAIGALMVWGPRSFRPFHLPGDFVFGGPGWKVYLPLGTLLLLNLVLILLGWVFLRK
jgi:hypothetical protein